MDALSTSRKCSVYEHPLHSGSEIMPIEQLRRLRREAGLTAAQQVNGQGVGELLFTPQLPIPQPYEDFPLSSPLRVPFWACASMTSRPEVSTHPRRSSRPSTQDLGGVRANMELAVDYDVAGVWRPFLNPRLCWHCSHCLQDPGQCSLD
jgi:hypothetical protein